VYQIAIGSSKQLFQTWKPALSWMRVSTLAIFTGSKHKYTSSGPIAVANSADWLRLSISARGRHSSIYHKVLQHLETVCRWTPVHMIQTVHPSFFYLPRGALPGSRVKMRGHLIAHRTPLSPRTMKALSKEINSKSTTTTSCIDNGNRGHITCHLQDIIAYRGWKSPFCPLYSDCRP